MAYLGVLDGDDTIFLARSGSPRHTSAGYWPGTRVAAQVTALGLVFTILTDGAMSAQTGMIVGLLAVLIYVVIGGFLAVAWTDFIQMIVLVVGLSVIAVFSADLAGGAGVVLASARFAEQHAQRHGMALDRLARISGWGHRNAGLRLLDKFERSRDDRYVFPHLRQAVQDAWRRAGVAGIDAMDGVETHDCFTTTEYVAIDHLGLAAPGQSWQAVEDGSIAPGGRCPVNMSGGLIGCGHPVGATGARMLLDAARQVTGQAGETQIDGARRMQTLNIGGSCATVVSFVVER